MGMADGCKHLPLVARSNPAIESCLSYLSFKPIPNPYLNHEELIPNLTNLELTPAFNPNLKNSELMPKLNFKHFDIWHLINTRMNVCF
jgi:hypothetical protein